MDVPDHSGLIRKAVNAAATGSLMTPEKDAVMFDAVKSAVDRAYQDGVSVGYNPKRNAIYASIVIVLLTVMLGVGAWAAPQLQVKIPAAVQSQFKAGAPNWELAILQETSQQAALDFVVTDVKARIGTDWGFVSEIQYKDYLFVRLANLTDNLKIKVLVYHWDSGWKFYDEELN